MWYTPYCCYAPVSIDFFANTKDRTKFYFKERGTMVVRVSKYVYIHMHVQFVSNLTYNNCGYKPN